VATSVVPALIDAILAAATTALPAALTFDGWGVTEDPGDYLMVGVSDPDEPDESEAATVTQDQLSFGATRPRMEQGVIHMAARSVNGDVDQKLARDGAYAIHEALATALRTTNDLGVTGVMQLSNGANLRLLQAQFEYGAQATLLYEIAFKAAI
jgi:hypothetical protein